jgi:hypothetical protein
MTGKPLNIRKELFWDMDFQKLDSEKNRQIIIERTLCLGNLTEFVAIEKHYGRRKIINSVKKIGYLDPKTLEFVISYFHIKPEKLLCYTKKQLQHQHWD